MNLNGFKCAGLFDRSSISTSFLSYLTSNNRFLQKNTSTLKGKLIFLLLQWLNEALGQVRPFFFFHHVMTILLKSELLSFPPHKQLQTFS